LSHKFEPNEQSDNTLSMSDREIPSVLVMAYSRDFLVKELLENIPSNRKLYIHLDGPTSTNVQAIARTRSAIDKFINDRRSTQQEIFLKTNEHNLGPKAAFTSAISWAFNSSAELVVLEEDVRFSSQFFEYMDWCLKEFKNNSRISQINGFSPINIPILKNHIFETQNSYCWGWGTWKDRWDDNDMEIASKLSSLGDLDAFKELEIGEGYLRLWNDRISRLRNGFDTWDYQWNLSTLNRGRFAICPAFSLVANVGFGQDATNTRVPKKYMREPNELMELEIDFDSLRVSSFPSLFNTISDLIQFRTISFTPKRFKVIQSLYSYSLKMKLLLKRLLSTRNT
jgi:hypothetical protein